MTTIVYLRMKKNVEFNVMQEVILKQIAYVSSNDQALNTKIRKYTNLSYYQKR